MQHTRAPAAPRRGSCCARTCCVPRRVCALAALGARTQLPRPRHANTSTGAAASLLRALLLALTFRCLRAHVLGFEGPPLCLCDGARRSSGMRQHTSAYVGIRQHTSAYVSIATCDLSDEPLANANHVRIPLQHDSRDPPHLHSAQFHHRPHAPPTILIPSALAHRRHTSEPARAVSVFVLLCERPTQLGFSGSKTSKLSSESTSTGGRAIALRATLP